MGNVYSHAGSIGDIIAHLTPLCYYWQQSGEKQELYLNKNCHPHWRQSEETLRSLITLIEIQPYIAKVEISDGYRGTNLDHLFRHPWQSHMNLSDIIHHRLNIPHFPVNLPWLFNVEPKPIASVVIHRSPRYHTPFDWTKVLVTYPDIVFVGHWSEHQSFVAEFGPVSYWHTKTYLDLAQVIAGGDLFIGNQSSPYWVAQGLKKNIVLEIVGRNMWCWNSHYERSHQWYGSDNLPTLAQLPKTKNSAN